MRRSGIATLVIAAAVLATTAGANASTPDRALWGAAFAGASAEASVSDPIPGARYLPGEGLMRFRRDELARFAAPDGGHVDSLRISTLSLDARPDVALMRPGAAGYGEARSVDLTFVRDWPAALSVSAGGLSLDVSPHAGLGLTSGGGQSAEAGALVRLGERVQDRLLQAVGMKDDTRSRWYVFAGATGRAVGLNLLRTGAQARIDQEDGGGFVSEAQAGFGFRRGAMHAAVGYTHERINMRSLGEDSREDNRVGLTLSLR